MKKKLIFAVGAAVGYVVGTRKGRAGYEKLKVQASELWQNEKLQDGITRAEELAKDIPVVGGTVHGVAKKATDTVTAAANKISPPEGEVEPQSAA
ncbi:hypothetical protein B0I08_11264 [Glaciihabitans tibetensis]|uniref:YtxH domain-containing protein n=1 Tax=Glaciihabitans tibetensis TaxID=1266600 RepID=A0A2T0V3B6_9MICO|nr:hypothetical protein [Glaciihabitans tibetensis]PRY64679.1 hypothetical protein B0I08_11264 [Glaciihabitans tibetensis]